MRCSIRRCRVGALVLASLMVVDAVPVVAQAPQPPGHTSSAQAQSPEQAAWTPESFGVSLERIKRVLREAPPTGRKSLLQVEYHVVVVGQAPKIDVFNGVDLVGGPVQYGGMTHAEFMRAVTPKAFSAPSASLVSLALAAAKAVAGRAGGKGKDQKK